MIPVRLGERRHLTFKVSSLANGFRELGFQRVIATVQSANRASIRVVEKLGMRRESSFQRNGRELLVYSVCNVRDRELETG